MLYSTAVKRAMALEARGLWAINPTLIASVPPVSGSQQWFYHYYYSYYYSYYYYYSCCCCYYCY